MPTSILTPPPIVTTLASAQGPAGAPGGATQTATADGAVSGHLVIRASAAGAKHADCTLLADLGTVVGISETSALSGGNFLYRSQGPLEHLGWTWAVGPIYLGTGGALVQSLPPGAVFSQIVARALSATRIIIDPQPPVVLV